MNGGNPTVVLYGRKGCCLCEDALAVLERVSARRSFSLQQRDIEEDAELLRTYLERIPVVTIDGTEVFELFVDEAELERLLTAEADTEEPGGSARSLPGGPVPPASEAPGAPVE